MVLAVAVGVGVGVTDGKHSWVIVLIGIPEYKTLRISQHPPTLFNPTISPISWFELYPAVRPVPCAQSPETHSSTNLVGLATKGVGVGVGVAVGVGEFTEQIYASTTYPSPSIFTAIIFVPPHEDAKACHLGVPKYP